VKGRMSTISTIGKQSNEKLNEIFVERKVESLYSTLAVQKYISLNFGNFWNQKSGNKYQGLGPRKGGLPDKLGQGSPPAGLGRGRDVQLVR
jgi:hypothetical protein